jgi:putative ABC transport system permease protein
MGASVHNIFIILSSHFIKLVLLSCVIATPMVWFAMEIWLEDFAYRIQIPAWIFLLTSIIVLLITGITVSFQAIKVAISNPIKSLRTE